MNVEPLSDGDWGEIPFLPEEVPELSGEATELNEERPVPPEPNEERPVPPELNEEHKTRHRVQGSFYHLPV